MFKIGRIAALLFCPVWLHNVLACRCCCFRLHAMSPCFDRLALRECCRPRLNFLLSHRHPPRILLLALCGFLFVGVHRICDKSASSEKIRRNCRTLVRSFTSSVPSCMICKQSITENPERSVAELDYHQLLCTCTTRNAYRSKPSCPYSVSRS